MEMSDETQKKELEFKILDRKGFEQWAKEGGRPAREDGDVVTDEDQREFYAELDESTIQTEVRILHQLDVSLDIQGMRADDIPTALARFKEYLENKKPGETLERPEDDDLRETHFKPGEDVGRGVSPETIHRYLVACRRYYRFHMQVNRGHLNRPRAKGNQFHGPPINSERRGRLIDPEEFNEWIETVKKYQDYRPRYATWLIVAGVPLENIITLRWGKDLIIGSAGVSLREGIAPRELPREGQLDMKPPKTAQSGEFVFVSASAANPKENEGHLTLSGLRRLWTSARRSHQKRTHLAGPTMRDIKTVVENVDLRFAQGKWHYDERSATSPIKLRDKQTALPV